VLKSAVSPSPSTATVAPHVATNPERRMQTIPDQAESAYHPPDSTLLPGSASANRQRRSGPGYI
jgi:hypothetical protein